MPLWPKGGSVGSTGVKIACPDCGSIAHMTVRPAEWREIVAGKIVSHHDGDCVVCLACDCPFVVWPDAPGGIIKRRRVAAGVQVPSPREVVPKAERKAGSANEVIDGLSRDLGRGRILDEPD